MEGKKRRKFSKDGLWRRPGSRAWWTTVAGQRLSTGCQDREAARVVRARLEREAADPNNATARRTTVADMIAHVLEDRRAAKGRRGLVTEKTIRYHEEKLGHFARLWGPEMPLAEVTYDLVGKYIAQRRTEPGAANGTTVSQHTIHKELQDLRLGLRLESARNAYPHNVDHVTRSRRFAVGAKKCERFLTWPEIAALIGAFLATESIERAQQVAWHIAVGGRMSESEHAEMKDHDLTAWRVRVRGTKSKGADAVIPIAPAFRRLLEWALYGRPKTVKLFSPWLNFNRALKRACARAGIERCSSNDLRRTHMTLLSHAGIPNEVLKNISRHTTTRMLDERYVVDDLDVTSRLIEGVEWPALTEKGESESTVTSQSPENPQKHR